MPLPAALRIDPRRGVGFTGGQTYRAVHLNFGAGCTFATATSEDHVKLDVLAWAPGISHSQLAETDWAAAKHLAGSPVGAGAFTALAGWNGITPVTIDPAALGGQGTSAHGSLTQREWALALHIPGSTVWVGGYTSLAGWNGSTPVTVDPAALVNNLPHSTLGERDWGAAKHTPGSTVGAGSYNAIAGWNGTTPVTVDPAALMYVPPTMYERGSSGTTGTFSPAKALPIGTTITSASGYSYDAQNDAITVLATAAYRVISEGAFVATAQGSGTATAEIWLESWNGSQWTELQHSRRIAMTGAANGLGSSWSSTRRVSLNNGDKLRAVAQRIAGTRDLMLLQNYLAVEKVG